MSFKYPDAVIYRLKCLDTLTYYIGSAVNLDERMRRHKSIGNNTGSRSIIQGGKYEIKILEEIPCNVYTELFPTEQKYLDRYREKYEELVLNKNNPILNKEHKREREKISSNKWAANNREKIRANANEKFDCVCGGKYTRGHKARHENTSKIHQKYISKINENKI